MGVFLDRRKAKTSRVGLPHARGGVSLEQVVEIATALSSPRSWGCFPKTISIEGNVSVFPTLVGVFLSMVGFLSLVASLPHARGGVSITDEPIQRHTMSSPRSWGCFHFAFAATPKRAVFPTLVGVFLNH